MKLFHEEIFGPVTPVFKFSTDDGAGLFLHDVPGNLHLLMSGS